METDRQKEAERLYCRLMSSDPDFNDCTDAANFIRAAAIDLKGPDGFESWQDAAVSERIRRVKAEAELAELRRPQPEATAPAQDLAQEQAATMLIQRKKIQTLNAEIAKLQKKLSGVNSAAHRLAARLCAIPPAKTIRGNDLITREAVMGFVVEWRRQWNEANEAALASSADALVAGDRVDAQKVARYDYLASKGFDIEFISGEYGHTTIATSYCYSGPKEKFAEWVGSQIDAAIQEHKNANQT